jgi:hypothetical protein
LIEQKMKERGKANKIRGFDLLFVLARAIGPNLMMAMMGHREGRMMWAFEWPIAPEG